MDLISRCLQDDEQAWAELRDLTRPTYVSVLVRVLGPGERSAVPDLEQELLRRLLLKDKKALEKLRGAPDSEIRVFAGTIALNLARDHLRRRATRVTALSTYAGDLRPSAPPDPEEAVLRRQRLEEVREAAREMASDRDLKLFDGYFLEGKTAAELADRELSAKGVESVLHRHASRLRARFGREP